jgi:hypothetical protein
MEERKQLENWQLGNESTTKPLERVELMNQWLKNNRREIKLSTQPQVTETEPIGFIDKLPLWGS